MKIIRNRFVPPRQFTAMNFFGLLLCRRDAVITPEVINHERIHTRQMVEMGFVGFYLWYIMEWLVRLPMRGNAYYKIRFEREAYRNMNDLEYLKTRKPFAWWRMSSPTPSKRRSENA